jgi:protein-tyrosine phosphatase
MRAEVYPIAAVPCGRLAIMPRPRAGDWLSDETVSWRHSDLDVIVSLLQDDEVAELGLEQEPEACQEAGLRFLRFPVPDRGVPASGQELPKLVESLAEQLRQGRGVGIHCRIGVGRSAVVAVCVLRTLGLSLESAWEAVQRSRGLSVPDTPQQREWVSAWAAKLGAQQTLYRQTPEETSHVAYN